MTVPMLDSWPRTLPQLWRLDAPGPNGTVTDTEAMCVGAREEAYRRWPQIADVLDRDEALQILFAIVWRRYEAYDPGRRHGTGSLSGWLANKLPERLFDYWRSQHGRNGDGRRAREVLTCFAVDAADGSDPGTHRLDAAARGSADGWADDLGGVYAQADSGGTGPVRRMGGEASRRVTRVPAGSGEAERGQVVGGGAGGARRYADCECGIRSYPQPPNGTPGWRLPDFCPCGRSLGSSL